MQTSITHNCSQCGSELILVSEVTEKVEGSHFPQTTTVFRCSNQSCQDEKDKQTAKRVQLRKDKLEADQKRVDDKALEKANKITEQNVAKT